MPSEHKLEKLNKIIESGIDPYPSKFEITGYAKDLQAEYKGLEIGGKGEDKFSVAGRIMQLRGMGKVSFMNILDKTGIIQAFFRKNDLGDGYEQVKLLEVGDIIGVTGIIFKTKTGEITVYVETFELLTKSLQDLPEKYHGLKDQETRLRRRYVDLVSNREAFDLFIKRSEFIRNMRRFLDDNAFLEVETPVLEMVPGGAEARPFITKHNTLDIEMYLRISLELHLKRLMVGGYERVYELGKVFRNEGMSTQHLQEFTLLEFYFGYINYEQLMEFVKEFYQTVIEQTFGKLQFEFEGQMLDFSGDWERIDYCEIIKEKTGVDILVENTKEKLLAAIKNHGLSIEIEPKAGRGRIIDQFYKKYVRTSLIQPCFLINHPTVISPLAKKHTDNPELTQRFQILIAGSEVGNGFSELNDPIDQRERFEAQMKLRDEGDDEAQMLDENFIDALEIGMPPTSGFGVGIDRLLMMLTNQSSIREVVLFPTMRPDTDSESDTIDKQLDTDNSENK